MESPKSADTMPSRGSGSLLKAFCLPPDKAKPFVRGGRKTAGLFDGKTRELFCPAGELGSRV